MYLILKNNETYSIPLNNLLTPEEYKKFRKLRIEKRRCDKRRRFATKTKQ